MQKVKESNRVQGDKGPILALGFGDKHGIFQFIFLLGSFLF
jgi:hypothetical protein